jgi:hypothetical protein
VRKETSMYKTDWAKYSTETLIDESNAYFKMLTRTQSPLRKNKFVERHEEICEELYFRLVLNKHDRDCLFSYTERGN